jgi:hypothetical protein
MLLLFLQWLTAIASTVYGGTVLCFALLMALYPRLAKRPRNEIARVFRGVGPILGLSMGVWILGLLTTRYLDTGQISWAWSTSTQQIDLIMWITFAILWCSSFILEIWTLEPLRTSLGPDNLKTDPEAFDAGYARTTWHLSVNAILVVVWHGLFAALAAAP